MKTDITTYGWDDYFAEKFNELGEGFVPGRIAVEHKNQFTVITEDGEISSELAGRIIHKAKSYEDYPYVGDWVALKLVEGENKAVVQHVLPRRSKLSRKVVGPQTEEQIIAANVDEAFVVTSLNENFNTRRIERYLTVIRDSGISPIVILSKSDLCENKEEYVDYVKTRSQDAPVLAVSVMTGEGMEELRKYFKDENSTGKRYKTAVVLGSSGVGKSSIINALAGEDILTVQEVRESDSRGKHTTTRREMIVLETGGVIIDTPGMREVQVWEGIEGLYGAFQDVEDLAAKCKFTDCTHTTEPGCAVQEAISRGEITDERLFSYMKMKREVENFEKKQQKKVKINERKSKKKLTNHKWDRKEEE